MRWVHLPHPSSKGGSFFGRVKQSIVVHIIPHVSSMLPQPNVYSPASFTYIFVVTRAAWNPINYTFVLYFNCIFFAFWQNVPNFSPRGISNFKTCSLELFCDRIGCFRVGNRDISFVFFLCFCFRRSFTDVQSLSLQIKKEIFWIFKLNEGWDDVLYLFLDKLSTEIC